MRRRTAKDALFLGAMVAVVGGAFALWDSSDEVESAGPCSLHPDQWEEAKVPLGGAAPPEDRALRYGHFLTLNELVEVGRNQYEAYCRLCHGLDGKGNGPAADVLELKPTDLTRLANNNDGVFPWDAVHQSINGRSDTSGHDHPGMPVWGERWTDPELAEDEPVRPDVAAGARLRCVVLYLSTIQVGDQRPTPD